MVGDNLDIATATPSVSTTMLTELIATSTASVPPESTSAPTTEPPLMTNLPSKFSQQMKDLELWHQRMGHSSTQAIIETRKCTEGIPELPTNTSFFKCPNCEKAKMVKNSGNRSKDEDAYIPGQAYHMDLVFVSGPVKFNDLRTTTEDSVTVKQSRNRYIGFLTIIDVASRQLWTHMIKNKDPPTQYIDQFLKQHGIRQTNPLKAIITTSNKGYLAKSKAFQATVNQLNYEGKEINVNQSMNITPTLLSDHVNATITTDGGGELSASHDMQQTAMTHGYDVKTTALDASS